MDKSEIISKVIRSIPYSDQITFLSSRYDSVRFCWRGSTFRVSSTGMVEEVVTHGFLSGTNEAILIEQLLKEKHHEK